MTEPPVHRALLASDTSPDAERRQIEVWRRLSTLERARIIDGASRTVRSLALAGVRARHPGASDAMLVARYAELTLGAELARRVYPDLLARGTDDRE